MRLRFALISARKDLRRRAADPLALALWLGIPLLLGTVLSLLGSGSAGAPRGTVLIADEDGSWAGRAVEAALGQGALGSLFQVTRVAEDAGRRQVAAGEATALLIVPKGATRALLDARPVTLTLLTNPAQRILPSIVQSAAELLVEGTFYAQRVFAEPLRAAQAPGQPTPDGLPTDLEVGAIAAAVNDALRVVRPVLLPPVLEFPLQAPASTDASAPGTLAEFGRLFLPGLLFASLLFVAQGLSGDVWEERRQGTLRRALTAPAGVAPFLLGKLLAGAAVAAGLATVGLVVAVGFFGVPVGRALAALPWVTFAGTVLVALFLLPQVAAGSQRGANLLGTILVFPLMMIGGSFFPFEAMPPWMAAVGRWTPNGQAVARLKDILDGTAAPATLAIATMAMLLPAAASVAFATVRLRRSGGGA